MRNTSFNKTIVKQYNDEITYKWLRESKSKRRRNFTSSLKKHIELWFIMKLRMPSPCRFLEKKQKTQVGLVIINNWVLNIMYTLTSLTATSSPFCTFTPRNTKKNNVSEEEHIYIYIKKETYLERVHQMIHFLVYVPAYTFHQPHDPFFFDLSNSKSCLLRSMILRRSNRWIDQNFFWPKSDLRNLIDKKKNIYI